MHRDMSEAGARFYRERPDSILRAVVSHFSERQNPLGAGYMQVTGPIPATRAQQGLAGARGLHADKQPGDPMHVVPGVLHAWERGSSSPRPRTGSRRHEAATGDSFGVLSDIHTIILRNQLQGLRGDKDSAPVRASLPMRLREKEFACDRSSAPGRCPHRQGHGHSATRLIAFKSCLPLVCLSRAGTSLLMQPLLCLLQSILNK